MEKSMYMMMIEKSKTYNKITKKVVEEHVANIRKLDDEGKLEICGVFNDKKLTSSVGGWKAYCVWCAGQY